MTDREWPEHPNQGGEETLTGPESAQEEAASVTEGEALSSPYLTSQEPNETEGLGAHSSDLKEVEEPQTAQSVETAEPGGQPQEEASYFQEERAESTQSGETQRVAENPRTEQPDEITESGSRPQEEASYFQEERAESTQSGETQRVAENSRTEQPDEITEPGSRPQEEASYFQEERAESTQSGETQTTGAAQSQQAPSRPSAPVPSFYQGTPQTPPRPAQNPGWQTPYQQPAQNQGYGQRQYSNGWYPQQGQVPPGYYGRPPYQAPNLYQGQNQGQMPYGYPVRPAYYPGQPGYQGGYHQQPPVSPVPQAEPIAPPQPPEGKTPEVQEPTPPEKKKMNKKTKVFLWIIGIVLVLLGAAMVLYSVGLASGWFGQDSAQPPQTSSAAPEDDQTLLEIEEIPQDGMMTPNQVYEKVKHSVVAVVTYGQGSDLTDSPISSGSGIVFSEDGYIVTNSHVIGDSNQYPVKVVFTGQDENEEDQEYSAQIVGYDKRTDIAVLKINATGLTPAEFADSDQLKVGDTVLSLGNPGVAGENFTNTLTKGMVSAVNRTVTMSSINMQYIQTDAAINPGSSGGALLNLYGQVVGINAAKITTTEIEGICFAIPTNIAKDVINDIVKNGYVSDRVRLGVTIRSLSSYEAQMYNVPQGLVIVGFSSDSEMPSKGAEIGDIITAINGVETTSSNTLYSELEKCKAGDKVKLTIYRQASGEQRAKTFEIEVTLLEDKGETQSVIPSETP